MLHWERKIEKNSINQSETSMGTNQPYKCDEHGNFAVHIISNLPEGNVKIKPKEAMDTNQPYAYGVKRRYGDCDQEEVVLSSDEEVLPDALKNYERQKLQEANQSNLKHDPKQASSKTPLCIVVAGEPFTVTRIGEIKSNSPKPKHISTSQVRSGPSSSIDVSAVSQQSISRGVKR
ncbi:MAG: hypothetical protein PG981_001258 [Wolbachia endosymbiont of Ctenocephalides orientis wCori]|nr:MAG: hypothetical protein PG981_001258 [Wolbachia endosymbiont of Ctenocephalides orientis wCori]